ncbi:MAG: class I SAM-dependent methyltransferase [Saprospiraceae bacterium]|nr:class I SAM-dependent methyltransferase [Saprospiraceae bacterium]
MSLSSKYQNCPLCKGASKLFFEDEKFVHYQCQTCRSVFLKPELRLNAEDEEQRYLNHNNDINDVRYHQFVSPITNAILIDFSSDSVGLDYGAGTGSAISKILSDKGYTIKQYDPFFHIYPELLQGSYDYIACCEVMEHFFEPRREFEKLQGLLKPGGKLYCMTELFQDNIPFSDWYYKNDPTHVFLYHADAIAWIQKNLGFSEFKIDGRMITFENI